MYRLKTYDNWYTWIDPPQWTYKSPQLVLNNYKTHITFLQIKIYSRNYLCVVYLKTELRLLKYAGAIYLATFRAWIWINNSSLSLLSIYIQEVVIRVHQTHVLVYQMFDHVFSTKSTESFCCVVIYTIHIQYIEGKLVFVCAFSIQFQNIIQKYWRTDLNTVLDRIYFHDHLIQYTKITAMA